jgi:hypothetical protein
LLQLRISLAVTIYALSAFSQSSVLSQNLYLFVLRANPIEELTAEPTPTPESILAPMEEPTPKPIPAPTEELAIAPEPSPEPTESDPEPTQTPAEEPTPTPEPTSTPMRDPGEDDEDEPQVNSTPAPTYTPEPTPIPEVPIRQFSVGDTVRWVGGGGWIHQGEVKAFRLDPDTN